MKLSRTISFLGKFSDVNNDSWYATDVYKCSEYCLNRGQSTIFELVTRKF